MLDRATLSREHAALGRITHELERALDARVPDLAGIGSLRWRMSRVLLVHLAKEDRLLYPRLRRSDRPGTGALAERFAAEMGGLAADFTDYVRDWPAARMAANWSRFGIETRRIITALRDRIEREERQLYPLIG